MTEHCICCDTVMLVGLRDWHKVCPACRYEKATLTPTINETTHSPSLNEGARALGLRRVRQINFRRLLQQILKLIPRGSTLLDVGCAHGWFLEIASTELKVEGIEPDRSIYEETLRRGLPLRYGYFPEALAPSDRYDAITFNDVIEHIPDVRLALQAVTEHLNTEGILLLNVPNRDGVFYRLSKVFCRLGVPSFFDRLWQVGLPSPHLHYFNRKSLTKLLVRSGFKVQSYGRLETIVLSGLYKRISYVGTNYWLVNVLLYLAVAAVLPILKLLPSDIFYIVATPERR
jgi:2-polyprenyl-3-methyl-5-hydroxy-6-metoxy-1,4-benzoquinol methylase